MSDDPFRVIELSLQGFNCSQILLAMALEAQGKSNPDLVRSMSGLLAGLGCGKVCGALTGGCCLLGLYGGKGTAEEQADERLSPMLSRFVEWFEQEYASRYGGTDCHDITQDDASLRTSRCLKIVIETFGRLKEILTANGYNLSDERSEG
jgi:C_GCAxxG_C_C family probable redox protein